MKLLLSQNKETRAIGSKVDYMNKKNKKYHTVLSIVAILGIVALGSLSAQPLSEEQNIPMEVATGEMAPSQAEGILYMREEEKLARDVYLALYDVWGIRTFANIARAEQKHMDAVASLIESQGLVDPAADTKKGEFMNPDLAALYTSLVELGSQSPQDALTVGAIIEDLDISDLDAYLLVTDDPYAKVVYANLLKGSENHMRSFTRQLSRYGVAYEARYITAERLEEILSR